MKRTCTLIGLFIALIGTSQTWEYHWAKNIASNGDEKNAKVATTSSGDIYASIEVQGAVATDGISYDSPVDDGRDVLIIKYDADGTMLWMESLAGDGPENTTVGDEIHDMACDSQGNLFVAGQAGGEATLCGTSIERGAFFAKISSDGDLLWIYGEAEFSIAPRYNSVMVDDNDDVYVGGNGETEPVQMSTGTVYPIVDATGAVQTGGYVCKVAGDGTFQWCYATDAGTPSHMAIDSDGNIIIGAKRFGAGDGLNGNNLVKLNPAEGTQVWHRNAYHVSNDDQTRDLGVFVHPDNSITHVFKASTGSQLGYEDGFLSTSGVENNLGLVWEVNADGTTIELREITSQFSDIGYELGDPNFDWNKTQMNAEGQLVWFGEFNGDCVLADGTMIAASDFYSPITHGKDALVMVTNTDGTIDSWSFKTGSGRQRFLDGAILPDGKVVGVGLHDAPTIQIFTGTTEFGDANLPGVSEDEGIVVVLTPGDPPADIVDNVFEIEKNKLNLWPNPSRGAFQIDADVNLIGAKFQILNNTGQVVLEGSINESKLQHNLSAGVYVLRVQKGNDMFNQAFIAE